MDIREQMAAVPEFDRFLAVNELTEDIGRIAREHSDIARLERVGTSRLGEPIQADIEGLAELQAAGVLPGASVEVSEAGGRIRLTVVGGTAIDLPVELAQHVYLAR